MSSPFHLVELLRRQMMFEEIAWAFRLIKWSIQTKMFLKQFTLVIAKQCTPQLGISSSDIRFMSADDRLLCYCAKALPYPRGSTKVEKVEFPSLGEQVTSC